MKTFLSMTTFLFLSACSSGGSSSTTPNQKNEQAGELIETGTCSSEFVNRFNTSEQNLINFQTYGLRGAGYLVLAYQGFRSIIYDYGKISCMALDRESKQSAFISREYVANYLRSARATLLNEYENCQYTGYPKNSDEKNGCLRILQFVSEDH